MPDPKRKVRGDDPALSSPKAPPGMRKLEIRGETWYWRYGNTIAIVDPKGARHNIELTAFQQSDWSSIERDKWKGNHRVEPSEIVDYIDRKILGYVDDVGFPRGAIPEGYQMPLLKDCKYVLLKPRGMWQFKSDPWLLTIFSPEGVKTVHRVYDVLDMSLDKWMDLKVEAIKAAGATVQDLVRRDGHVALVQFDAPNIPKPTQADVYKYLLQTYGSHLADGKKVTALSYD